MVPSLEVTGQCQWVTTPVPGATNSKLSSDALGNFNVAVVVSGDPSTVHSWACAADAADPPITSTTSSAVPIRAIRLFIPLTPFSFGPIRRIIPSLQEPTKTALVIPCIKKADWRLLLVGRRTEPDPQNDEIPLGGGISRAAEGIRTLDLLHGKQTL